MANISRLTFCAVVHFWLHARDRPIFGPKIPNFGIAITRSCDDFGRAGPHPETPDPVDGVDDLLVALDAIDRSVIQDFCVPDCQGTLSTERRYAQVRRRKTKNSDSVDLTWKSPVARCRSSRLDAPNVAHLIGSGRSASVSILIEFAESMA